MEIFDSARIAWFNKRVMVQALNANLYGDEV